ncbi:AraC family transcriptional regulator [Planktotalea sp.]|uniref:helix-turn-helix domain-containing protein n=1 Tax=Planktotalea sp. TaxID=2029877 RepID=UPI0032977B02
MYDPKGNGKDKAVTDVAFVEAKPPEHLRNIVHRFLELRCDGPLPDPYRFHALPDACTYVVFDRNDPRVTGVTKLRIESEEFDLGTAFHFVNIRFLPGVWQFDRQPTALGQVKTPYEGAMPLLATSQALMGQDFDSVQTLLTGFVEQLVRDKLVMRNPVTETIFRNIEDVHNVADMAELADLSPRQLQRVLKATTGFSPHDFLKIIRLQLAISGNDASYADQSHFIHSFRRATGYTPGKYTKKFDV